MITTKLHPQFITDAQGQRISVILSIKEFNDLMEDLEDLSVIAERRNDESIPFNDALKELGIHNDI